MAHILAMRFSALGDVAMAVPVVASFAAFYPQHEITVLSRTQMAPFFERMSKNVHFRGVELEKYRGVDGLNRLYKELSETRFDAVADLHNVLRTQYLSLRYRMEGVPIATLKKDRVDRWRLTRSRNKMLQPLVPGIERYCRVFAEIGYPFPMSFRSIYGEERGPIDEIVALTGEKGKDKWLGIAPYAGHVGKVYPLEKMENVISHFSSRPDTRIFLFGGGEAEKAQCEAWSQRYTGVTSLVGYCTLSKELNVISQLDVMLSMDSSNMHLASLVGTPVVSVWGATHPYAGFMGWRQSMDNVVQTHLSCRPCSAYGKKLCQRGDYACMEEINPERIIETVEKNLV